jgi:hypothetical protein
MTLLASVNVELAGKHLRPSPGHRPNRRAVAFVVRRSLSGLDEGRASASPRFSEWRFIVDKRRRSLRPLLLQFPLPAGRELRRRRRLTQLVELAEQVLEP